MKPSHVVAVVTAAAIFVVTYRVLKRKEQKK